MDQKKSVFLSLYCIEVEYIVFAVEGTLYI